MELNNMKKLCKCCGDIIENRHSDLCQSCYVYFKEGGVIHPLPKEGNVEKDERGYVICHICGKAYKKLGSHVANKHNMTTDIYREKFGLCSRTKITETNYSQKMSAFAYKNNMPEQLKAIGLNTRIKFGEKDKRKGKKIRLQERIHKQQRKKQIKEN